MTAGWHITAHRSKYQKGEKVSIVFPSSEKGNKHVTSFQVARKWLLQCEMLWGVLTSVLNWSADTEKTETLFGGMQSYGERQQTQTGTPEVLIKYQNIFFYHGSCRKPRSGYPGRLWKPQTWRYSVLRTKCRNLHKVSKSYKMYER